ncbi:hypothetical protein E2C01_047378 [Portunus trituberculatus]|uniref:Uncharacterized protein n=1 Tax=Portunus trituberculatus TaxID=210409 RepID=A0A5B7GAB5_PORTR|nr:hypothetical protein [Portunus trituberculatus]
MKRADVTFKTRAIHPRTTIPAPMIALPFSTKPTLTLALSRASASSTGPYGFTRG